MLGYIQLTSFLAHCVAPFITPTRRAALLVNARTIEKLPAELTRLIMNRLPIRDVKSLRLTSPLLAPHAAAIVHRKVVLSPLFQDLHSFIAVATAPWLAELVRELEWHEIFADGTVLDQILNHDSTNRVVIEDDNRRPPKARQARRRQRLLAASKQDG